MALISRFGSVTRFVSAHCWQGSGLVGAERFGEYANELPSYPLESFDLCTREELNLFHFVSQIGWSIEDFLLNFLLYAILYSVFFR